MSDREKKKKRLREFTDNVNASGKGMWKYLDDEVEDSVGRRDKARIALILGVAMLIMGILYTVSFIIRINK